VFSGVLVAVILASARLFWHRTRVPTVLSRTVRRGRYLRTVLAESQQDGITTVDVLAPQLTAANGDAAVQRIQNAWAAVNLRGKVRVLTVEADECIKAGAELLEKDIEVRIGRRKLQSESLSFHVFGVDGLVRTVIVNQHRGNRNKDQPVRIAGAAATQLFDSHFEGEWANARPWEAVVTEKVIDSASPPPDTDRESVLRSLAEACARLGLGPRSIEKILPHLAFRHSAAVIFIVGQPGAGKSYVRTRLAERLRDMRLETRSLTDYPYAYLDFLHAMLKLNPPRGNGDRAHEGGAFAVREEGVLAPALRALATETRSGTPSSEVTLVEFARADLVFALQEFAEAAPWARVIHVSAPEELRLARLNRRVTPPEVRVDGNTIKLKVSDNHLLPSVAERSLYGFDHVEELKKAHRWRDKIFEIDNSLDDAGSNIEAGLTDFIETVIKPYRTAGPASQVQEGIKIIGGVQAQPWAGSLIKQLIGCYTSRPARVWSPSATGMVYDSWVRWPWSHRLGSAAARTGEGPGSDAGVGGPACRGCGCVDRLIAWPGSR
jgi:hypothetical protein